MKLLMELDDDYMRRRRAEDIPLPFWLGPGLA